MKMLGQRWEYRVGNSVVKVDNGFSWSMWGQERLIVNDEIAHSSSGWMRFGQKYTEPWLTMLGEEELRVVMRSRMLSILCQVSLGETQLEPHACLTAAWTGKARVWPEEAEWQVTDTGEAIGFAS